MRGIDFPISIVCGGDDDDDGSRKIAVSRNDDGEPLCRRDETNMQKQPRKSRSADGASLSLSFSLMREASSHFFARKVKFTVDRRCTIGATLRNAHAATRARYFFLFTSRVSQYKIECKKERPGDARISSRAVSKNNERPPVNR